MKSPGPFVGVLFLFDVLVTLVVIFFILRKNRTEFLNQIMALTLSCFCVYLIFEGLIYLLPVSFLAFFNLFRDLSFIGAIMAATFAAFSGIYILKGKDYLFQIQIVGPIIFLGLFGVVIATLNDHVYYNSQTDTIVYNTSTLGLVGLTVIPILLMVIAIIFYYRALKTIDSENPMYKKALLLPISLVIITIGIGYYGITMLIGLPTETIGSFGHLFFIIASFLFVYTFK
ncbi:MAG: hypothetical protein ACFFBD_02240 [Candidatus Hodarchaeota archaeon]